MAPKRPASKGPKLMHGFTPLIRPKAWLSTMGKMRMSSASTSVFYPLPYPQIRTTAFYHRPISRSAHLFYEFAQFCCWLINILCGYLTTDYYDG